MAPSAAKQVSKCFLHSDIFSRCSGKCRKVNQLFLLPKSLQSTYLRPNVFVTFWAILLTDREKDRVKNSTSQTWVNAYSSNKFLHDLNVHKFCEETHECAVICASQQSNTRVHRLIFTVIYVMMSRNDWILGGSSANFHWVFMLNFHALKVNQLEVGAYFWLKLG